MRMQSDGYYFKGNIDSFGTFGLLNLFSTVNNGDKRIVKIVTTILSKLENNEIKLITTMPCYLNRIEGFKGIVNDYGEDIDRFIKGNKALYSKVGTFNYVVSGTWYFDRHTGAYLDSELELFMIKGAKADYFEDKRGNKLPALICNKVSTGVELNNVKVSEATYDMLLAQTASLFDDKGTSSRTEFIKSLTLKQR